VRIAVEGDKSLYVEHHCAGSGPAVVLVHGGGCNRRTWDGVVPALLRSGRSVVTFDLRACGWSDQDFELLDISELASDVGRIIDALALPSIDLMGWSLGGAIAVQAAAELGSRVRRLVVVGAASPRYAWAEDYPDGRPQGNVEGVAVALEIDRPGFYQGLAGILLHQDRPAVREWFYEMFMSSGTRHTETLVGLATLDQRPLLAELTVPTLICHGEHDQFAPLAWGEALHAGLPNSRLRVFEESGHAPFIEEPEAFREAVLSFLDEDG
jgi:non-heme chloroperoxidase